MKDTAFKYLCGFFFGLAFYFLVLSNPAENCSDSLPIRSAHTRRDHQRNTAGSTDIFTLCVTLNFQSTEGIDKFRPIFISYSDWVEKNEPTTLSYQLLRHDSKPLEVMILERYVTKDAYSNVHRKSDRFREFNSEFLGLQNISGGQFAISGNSYYDVPYGFV